ncbi:hypothetical protein CLF_103763 [Clonorchis sinensis]|uniref:Uncharacterized protein n=1 Tax=Clonorchis sinensis TaxID=79923 RepID=G7YAC0_CLOSI|nr:hypothetical protein CLF_103763 [Clonorchis sinensis]
MDELSIKPLTKVIFDPKINRSINLDVLGLQIKQLCSLLRSDSDSRAVKQEKTDNSPPPGQDSLSSVCRTKLPVKKPTVYKVIRPTRYDSGKAHKTYGRAKLNMGDNIVQENIQGVVNSATAIRVDITHATKMLCLLEDLIRMFHRKYCKRGKPDIKVPSQTDVPDSICGMFRYSIPMFVLYGNVVAKNQTTSRDVDTYSLLSLAIHSSSSREAEMTGAAEFADNVFHNSFPSPCWTFPGSTPRKSVNWQTEHVIKAAQVTECDEFIYRGLKRRRSNKNRQSASIRPIGNLHVAERSTDMLWTKADPSFRHRAD